VIRTRHVPFVRSRPSLPLLGSLVAVVAIAIILPFTPLGAVLGFQPPSTMLLLALAGVVLVYLVIADAAKGLFFRAEGRRRPPHPRVRHLRRAISGYGG